MKALTTNTAVVGLKVGYNNVNLITYRGEIVKVEAGPFGSNCLVKWNHNPAPIFSTEVLSNLRALNS